MKLPLSIAVAALASSTAGAETSPYAGVTAEQSWDSNVMNSRGDDGVTRITPRVGLLHESSRLRFLGEYRLGLHAYATGSADDSINHRGALSFLWEATPRLELEGDAMVTVGDDSVLLDRPGVIIPRGGFVDVGAHAGVKWRATRRTRLALDYLARASRFDLSDGPDPQAYDGDEHRLDATASWRATRRLTLKGITRGQRFVSYGTTASLGGSLGAGAGLEYRLARLWRARAHGGGLWFEGSPIFGWFAQADLTRTGDRWRVALRGVHDVYGGTSAAEAVWSESAFVDGALRLSKTVGVRARAGGYRGGAAPNYDVNVSGLTGRAELAWLAWRGVRLDLFAEHRAQDADGGLGFGDVHRTVAGVRLTAVTGLDLLSLGETP
jgi:hypothetical protein